MNCISYNFKPAVITNGDICSAHLLFVSSDVIQLDLMRLKARATFLTQGFACFWGWVLWFFSVSFFFLFKFSSTCQDLSQTLLQVSIMTTCLQHLSKCLSFCKNLKNFIFFNLKKLLFLFISNVAFLN